MDRDIIVFLRHYNDIDHIVPVLYNTLNGEYDGEVQVVLYEDAQSLLKEGTRKIRDFRIREIAAFSNCSVTTLRDVVSEVVDQSSMQKIVHRFGERLPIQIPGFIESYSDPLAQCRQRDLGERTYERLIADRHTATVVFDWVKSREFVSTIVEMANNDGHRTVCLPHGDSPFANHWNTSDDIVSKSDFNSPKATIRELANDKVEIEYQHWVSPNEPDETRWNHDGDDRWKVLGSPRYNQRWVEKLQQIAPKFDPDSDTQSTRIVLFSRPARHTVDQQSLAEAIRILAAFPSVSLVVKHHTRAPDDTLHREFATQSGSSIDDIDNIQIVSDDVHSVSLLEWGDVFVDCGTSVTFEAIVRNKPVLVLEYLHLNETAIARHSSDAAAHSRDELYQYMQRVQKFESEPGAPPTYEPEEREHFIETMIRNPEQPVLDAYTELLIDE